MSLKLDLFFFYFLINCFLISEQLASIPGLEEVTVDGLNQQQSVQTNGPAPTSQNQTDGSSAGAAPPSVVSVQIC